LVSQTKSLLGKLPFGIGSHGWYWRQALKRAKIKNLHVHDLRHTLATWMFNTGSDEATIAQVLGHSHRSMTSIYTHMGGSPQIREAVQRAADAMCQHRQ
jgi:integrase